MAEKISAIGAEVLGPAGSESDEEKQELEVYLLVLESRVPIIPLMLATAGIGKLAAMLEIEKDICRPRPESQISRSCTTF